MYFTPKRLKLYLGALLVLQVIICFGFRSSIRSGAIDYRLYYTAGYMLRTGNAHLLYDYATEKRIQDQVIVPAPIALPFFAPPFAALPFVPLSLLPYIPSLLVFGILNLAILALTIRAMLPHLRNLSARWPPLPALLFLSFLPAGYTVMMGQVSILVLCIDCLAFIALETGSPLLAGLLCSLSLIKFQTAVPIAILFLLWRQWRFIAGFLCGATVLSALSAWILGVSGPVAYLRSIFGMSSLAGTPMDKSVGVIPRAMANLYGLFFCLTPTNRLATILTVVASLALLAWAATRRPSFPLALLVALLVSYHLYPCDLTLLLLPLSLLCNQLFAEDPTSADPTPAPPPTRLSWLQSHRRTILLCSIGAFLIGPAFVEVIVNNVIFLLALPILALTLCPLDWSTLTLPRAPITHRDAPQPTTA